MCVSPAQVYCTKNRRGNTRRARKKCTRRVVRNTNFAARRRNNGVAANQRDWSYRRRKPRASATVW
jgi:hypothetical protein